MKGKFDTVITSKKSPFKLNIREVVKYKDLTWLFVQRDFKTRYKQNYTRAFVVYFAAATYDVRIYDSFRVHSQVIDRRGAAVFVLSCGQRAVAVFCCMLKSHIKDFLRQCKAFQSCVFSENDNAACVGHNLFL